MATFVLVHGAWHGSWCWNRVRRALQAQGHEVFTPTLTGLAERSHLLSPDIDLQTHIEDVVSLIRYEDLSDVVLCGHSYAGIVVSGVADRLADRIAALVYLDAFVLADGQSLHDALPPDHRQGQMEAAAAVGEGWRVPPIPALVFNVNAEDAAWVDSQCTPQPLACFQQPLRLRGGPSRARVNHFIYAADWDQTPFTGFYEQAKTRGWTTSEIACGHDVMLDRPEALVAELTAVARAAL